MKFLVSKALSYGIITGSFLLKVPQIMKIQKNASVEGLARSMYALELLGYIITISYNVNNGYPLSTFGENISIAVQSRILLRS
jgi:hypothetical protein